MAAWLPLLLLTTAVLPQAHGNVEYAKGRHNLLFVDVGARRVGAREVFLGEGFEVPTRRGVLVERVRVGGV